MDASACESRIESAFRKQVQSDRRVRGAFLLVQSEKLGVDLNIAESGNGSVVSVDQPNHLASVGKLFTATLIAKLHEQGKLDFTDRIGDYLDAELMKGLHVYRGRDYSNEITIRHLLMQTSGLYDVFYSLWERMMADPSFTITTREAISWGKEHMKPVAEPGKKHHYTDTNYYLLGFIVESITGKPFHEAMHEMVFDPLGMRHAWMHGYSAPTEQPEHSAAGLYMRDIDFMSVKGVPAIDHAGGSVIAPLSEYLRFLKALTGHRLIREETLEQMINDDVHMGFPTAAFDYGYSIWKFRSIPLLMPPELYSWGCVGVTGAFLFFHPGTESHIIGTFNNYAYRGKALTFTARSVIKELLCD
ncbi:MAG: serine hydrolase domain-containing protein [Spirochaetota bacterium]